MPSPLKREKRGGKRRKKRKRFQFEFKISRDEDVGGLLDDGLWLGWAGMAWLIRFGLGLTWIRLTHILMAYYIFG